MALAKILTSAKVKLSLVFFLYIIANFLLICQIPNQPVLGSKFPRLHESISKAEFEKVGAFYNWNLEFF